jgi:hypothetical protein
VEEPEQVEWLPPQAAGAAPAPQFSQATVDPAWPPPTVPAPPRSRGDREPWSLILGVAGLVLFVFPAGFGLVFLFNLPASILAWSLGHNAGERGRTGKVLGIVGTVLGVLAVIGWGIAIALSDDLRHQLQDAVEEGQR